MGVVPEDAPAVSAVLALQQAGPHHACSMQRLLLTLVLSQLGCASLARQPPPAAAGPTSSPADAVGATPAERVRSLSAELEAEANQWAEEHHIPGLVAGLVVDGELVWTHALGKADVSRGTVPDADTVFRIASMTKSFTALALLAL